MFLCLAVGLLACSSRGTGQAAAGDGPRRVGEEFFEIEIPADWVEQPRRTVAQQSAVVAAYHAPLGQADIRVIVSRPVPFQGDAHAFSLTNRPGLELMGMTVVSERQGDIGGLPATVVDGQAPRGTMRWWFFARDGMAGMVQCGGEGARSIADLAPCDRIASTFRLTGPLRSGAAAPSPSEPEREVTLNGFTFTMPAGWEVFEGAPLPSAVFVVRSQTMAGSGFPNAILTVEPFAGDVDAYSRVGDEQAAVQGVRILDRRPATLLGAQANQVLSDFPAAAGGHRALSLETVRDGRAYVLTCSGAPNAFEVAQAACELIAPTLRPAGGRP